MLLDNLLRSRALPAWRCALVFVLVVLSVAPAAAEWRNWAEGADYDPSIPDPDTWLGRPFAERHTTVDEIFGYVEALAAASDRVRVESMGRSVQGDPLLLIVITDPSVGLDPQERTERLAIVRDPWKHDADARRRAAEGIRPATWVACSVHGDEASGSDAGLALAYHLAADRSEATLEILRESIVLIGPSHNPDGRRRFLNHVRNFGRQTMPADPSPWAAEHWQGWPGGRTNHFYFDLNRDWAFLTQQETRHHVESFLRWRPQVFVDLHEMGRESSYYFPPPADPINPNVPDGTLEWFEIFGRANADAFDARGFDYFVREDFDLFYPGYGDSWPTLQGAVGMTYEQATTRGRALRQRGGRIVGYDEAVEKHFVAAHTTVRTAAARSRELVDAYVAFHDEAQLRAKDDPREELVFSAASKSAEATRLADVLVRQGIEVMRTTAPRTVQMTPYDGEGRVDVELPAGSFRVPMDQASYLLVRSLLDPHTPMDEDFLAQERVRRERGLHNRFYDVTAWSLVFSYGVDAYTSSRRLDVPSERFSVGDGNAITSAPQSARLAWVVPYRDNAALETLIALWNRGIVVETILDAFVHDGMELPRGSFVVKRTSNPGVQDLDGVIGDVVASTGVELHAVNTSWTDSGPSFGSGRARVLHRPRVALVTGPGVSPASVGGLNWLLEDRYGVEFTTVMLSALRRIDLAEFDAVLVPSLDDAHMLPLDALDRWVESGGVLVAVGEGAAAIVEPHGEDPNPWTTVERIRDLAELGDEAGLLGEFEVGTGSHHTGETLDHLPPERRPLNTPGAIVRLELDPTHYLTLGERGFAHAPLLSDRILTPSKTGRTVARIDAERPRRSGFMWPVMEEALKDKAFLVEESHGRGRVILFAEDPGFRGTWEGLHRLLLNGLLLGPSLAG